MKRVLPFVLLVPLALAAGCKSNPNKPKKPKENPAMASEIEDSFKQRWVEKRANELMGLGLRPDLARQQALEEFKVRYQYTHSADK